MIKKDVTKTYVLLEKEDLEKVVSKFFDKPVKVGEMEVEFQDGVDVETSRPTGSYITIDVKGEEETFDLPAYSYEEKGYDICEDLGIEETDYFSWLDDEPFPDESKIFAFDTSEFKSYDRYTDSSD